jgi:hypothetical protein
VEEIEKRCFYKNSSSENTIKDIYSAIVKNYTGIPVLRNTFW